MSSIDVAPLAFAKIEPSGLTTQQDKKVPQKPSILQSDPEFTRSDWKIYISDLSQRAGVAHPHIRRLVLKELADNALDEMDRVGRSGEVTITQDDEDTFTVTDQGRGFDDTPATRPQILAR